MIRMTPALSAALERFAQKFESETAKIEQADLHAIYSAYRAAGVCNCIVSTHRILHEKSCASLNGADREDK